MQIYTNEKAIVVDLATCQVSQIFSDVWQDSVTAQDDLGEIDQVAESHITMKYSEDIGINFDFEFEQKIAKFTTSRLGNILQRTEESESLTQKMRKVCYSKSSYINQKELEAFKDKDCPKMSLISFSKLLEARFDGFSILDVASKSLPMLKTLL